VHLKQFVGLLHDGAAEVPSTVKEIAQLYLEQIDVARIED
jgi:hypothetical protein